MNELRFLGILELEQYWLCFSFGCEYLDKDVDSLSEYDDWFLPAIKGRAMLVQYKLEQQLAAAVKTFRSESRMFELHTQY